MNRVQTCYGQMHHQGAKPSTQMPVQWWSCVAIVLPPVLVAVVLQIENVRLVGRFSARVEAQAKDTQRLLLILVVCVRGQTINVERVCISKFTQRPGTHLAQGSTFQVPNPTKDIAQIVKSQLDFTQAQKFAFTYFHYDEYRYYDFRHYDTR